MKERKSSPQKKRGTKESKPNHKDSDFSMMPLSIGVFDTTCKGSPGTKKNRKKH